MTPVTSLDRRTATGGLASLLGTFLLRAPGAFAQGQQLTSREQTEDGSDQAAANGQPAFPLSVASDGRYFVDAAGSPFLLNGDTAWSLIADLKLEEAETYLKDRRRRGFNALLVNLLEHRFARNAPANAYGQRPFLTDGDFETPNDEYFSHAEWIVRQAEEMGFLVLLAPAYLGFDGGIDGWYQEMSASGPSKLREYGRYVGRRFGTFRNILWVHAGDYNAADKNLVRAIVDGIREYDRRSLHTAHTRSEYNALDYWEGEPWLQVDNVFTYKSVRAAAARAYKSPLGLPFILIESAYENEYGATEYRVRIQAYQALLTGAAGHVFGNNPIWHFGGPGLFPAPVSWTDALGSRGAQSMAHLWKLFITVPWWQLRPAPWLFSNLVGDGDGQPTAAQSADGTVAVVYFPTVRDVRISLGNLAGPKVTAQWFDPASGYFHPSQALGPGPRRERFRPGGRNSANCEDWVLVLRS